MINDNQLEVPCIGSIKSGDSVMIVTRNGEPTAIAAAGWGDSMSESVEAASQTATEAAAVAAATNQHFTFDANGAHVSTAVTTDQQGNTVADLTTGSVQTLGSQGNLQMLDGKLLRSDTSSGTSFYDGTVPPTDQDLASHIVASFNIGGAQIGRSGESHMELDYHSLRMEDKDSNTYFEVADLRGLDGKAELTENFEADGRSYSLAYLATQVTSCTVDGEPASYTTSTFLGATRVTLDDAPDSGSIVTIVYETESGDAKAYTLGTRDSRAAVGAISYAEGRSVEASGYACHAEGDRSIASGRVSHAEGVNTVASGNYSHAEGATAYATGTVSHAEGSSTTASGPNSHAEGDQSKATGQGSHAEGWATIASGNNSHAQNERSIALGSSQTVIGRFNSVDQNDEYSLIIGNGGEWDDSFVDPDNPNYDYDDEYTHSNALTVDWDGKVKMGQILSIHSLPSSSAQIDTSANNGATSASVVFGRTEIMDKNGTWVSTYGSNTQTNGQTRSYIGCNNMKTNGTMATNYFSIGVNKDGSCYYSVTDPAAFRNMIGAAMYDFYQATGASGTMSTTAGTITPVTLVTTGAVSNGSGFSISGGGIKVANAGKYRVTASIYILGTNATFKGVYVKKNNNSTGSTGELMGLHYPYTASGVQVGPKVVSLAANDVLYLCGRIGGVAGTLYTNNSQTFLLVERIA